jgi:hypothetical protein
VPCFPVAACGTA